MLDRFRDWMLGRALKAASFQIVAPWVSSSFFEPSWDRLISDAYKANSAVLACLQVLSFAFPEPELKFYKKGDETELPGHASRQLIERPNPIMGEAELWAYTIVYMALGGNAYWHKVRNDSGRVIELWPHHAGRITPIPGGDSWIRGYEYDVGTGEKQSVPSTDIVHFKWPLPDTEQPWLALPPPPGRCQGR